MDATPLLNVDENHAYINLELSWLSFTRRVLVITEDDNQPLLERIKFTGIMGMIFDEFVMKRLGGLYGELKNQPGLTGSDGLRPCDELELCREELAHQSGMLTLLFEDIPRPTLIREGIMFLVL